MAHPNPAHDDSPPRYNALEYRPPRFALEYDPPRFESGIERSSSPRAIYMSPAQCSLRPGLVNWIQEYGTTVAAAPCLLVYGDLITTLPLARRSLWQSWLASWRRKRLLRGATGDDTRESQAPDSSLSRSATSGLPLRLGETETLLPPDEDWTIHYSWVLRLRAYTWPNYHIPSPWRLDVTIYFDNLPQIMAGGGLDWDTASVKHHRPTLDAVTDPMRPWLETSTYKGRIHGSSWQAEVVHRWRQRKYRGEVKKDLIAQKVNLAEIDQRIGRGRAKRVMAYYPGVAYGNDITADPLLPWQDTATARFVELHQSLMPGRGDRYRQYA